MKTIYYGRISTTEGQTSASQYEDATKHGGLAKHTHIDGKRQPSTVLSWPQIS